MLRVASGTADDGWYCDHTQVHRAADIKPARHLSAHLWGPHVQVHSPSASVSSLVVLSDILSLISAKGPVLCSLCTPLLTLFRMLLSALQATGVCIGGARGGGARGEGKEREYTKYV